MNVQVLKQFVDFLLAQDKRLKIQDYLVQSRDTLSNIVGAPGNTDFQNQFAAAYDNLKKAVVAFVATVSPAQAARLGELGGSRFFDSRMTSEIDARIAENSLTPTVVRDYMATLAGEREQFIGNLRQLSASLQAVGVTSATVAEGEAEIGLTIPQSLFHGRLDELTVQLRRFDLIFRFFSEAATGQAEHATVGDISSTTPQFFFGLSPETVAQLGAAFRWAIDTLGAIAKLKENLDSLRAQGLKKNQLKGIEEAIDERVAAAVDAKVKELTGLKQHTDDRRAELEKGLKWSLESVMAAVERGVTVELRFLPPAAQTDGKDDHQSSTTFNSLQKISQQLAFPEASDAPMLELPSPDPPASAANADD